MKLARIKHKTEVINNINPDIQERAQRICFCDLKSECDWLAECALSKTTVFYIFKEVKDLFFRSVD